MFFRETYKRRLAEELGCEDPMCFTVDRFCRLLCARVCGLSASTENNLFSMHDWLYQCAKPEIALCSASNCSSYHTSRVSTPRIDAESLKNALVSNGKSRLFGERGQPEEWNLRRFSRGSCLQVSFRALFCRFSPDLRFISDLGKAVQP